MECLVSLSTCNSNCFHNLFASCRWIPEVEEFQLASCNSSGIDCLSCFCSFTGPLHSIGNNPLFTCHSPELLENSYKNINHVSSKETISFFFVFCRGSCLKSFHGFFLSSEASAMLIGPLTSGLCTMPWIKH